MQSFLYYYENGSKNKVVDDCISLLLRARISFFYSISKTINNTIYHHCNKHNLLYLIQTVQHGRYIKKTRCLGLQLRHLDKYHFYILHLCKIFIEQRNRSHTLLKLIEAIALIWRVNSILRQAEANKYRLNSQNALKTTNNRDRTT